MGRNLGRNPSTGGSPSSAGPYPVWKTNLAAEFESPRSKGCLSQARAGAVVVERGWWLECQAGHGLELQVRGMIRVIVIWSSAPGEYPEQEGKKNISRGQTKYSHTAGETKLPMCNKETPAE